MNRTFVLSVDKQPLSPGQDTLAICVKLASAKQEVSFVHA